MDDLTLPEVAALLGMNAAGLRMAIARGSLPATKRGRDWFVSRAEVDRQLAKRGRGPERSLGVLVSFGYSKARTADGLRSLLDGSGVDHVVDVRLKPYSGNRAFSAGTRATVEGVGPAYSWVPDLDNLAYKAGGVQIRNLKTIEPAVLAPLRAGKTVALMCVCLEAETCHRMAIVDEAVRRLPGLTVRHL